MAKSVVDLAKVWGEWRGVLEEDGGFPLLAFRYFSGGVMASILCTVWRLFFYFKRIKILKVNAPSKEI